LFPLLQEQESSQKNPQFARVLTSSEYLKGFERKEKEKREKKRKKRKGRNERKRQE